MSFFSHRVDRSEIVEGDHIYTYRGGYAFTHHGIYVGNNEVIHFGPRDLADIIFPSMTSSASVACSSSVEHPSICCNGYRRGNSGVLKSCLNCFLAGGSLHRYQYGSRVLSKVVKRSGTSTTARSDETAKVVHRANHLLVNTFGDYHLTKNNCEDFALYCKTGLRSRNQGSPGGSGQVGGLISVPKAARDGCAIMSVPTVAAVAVSSASLAVAAPIGAVIGVGLFGLHKSRSDLGARTDVTSVEVMTELVPFRLPE